jgi:hypothetical protein
LGGAQDTAERLQSRKYDDMGLFTMLEHGRQKGLKTIHHAHKIDADYPIPIGVTGLTQSCHRICNSGIIAK